MALQRDDLPSLPPEVVNPDPDAEDWLGELVDWLNVLRPESGDDLHPIPGNPIVEGGTCPGLGDGWPTPDDATALVARVEVLASHDEVRGPNGLPVPGVEIEPGRVTAKVVPSP